MFEEVKILVEDREILAEPTLQLVFLRWGFELGRFNTFHCFGLGCTVVTF